MNVRNGVSSDATRRDVLGTLLAAPAMLDATAASRGDAADAASSRDFSPTAPPVSYPDPDVVVIHPSFNGLRVFNAPIWLLADPSATGCS